MAATFTPAERDYLASPPLGRLATVDRGGAPQNNPVAVFLSPDGRRLLIGGYRMGVTRKFRNAQRNPNVAVVIDELVSREPWVVRGIEVRGTAEALSDADPPMRGMSREVLVITPRWIGSWGLEPGQDGVQGRT